MHMFEIGRRGWSPRRVSTMDRTLLVGTLVIKSHSIWNLSKLQTASLEKTSWPISQASGSMFGHQIDDEVDYPRFLPLNDHSDVRDTISSLSIASLSCTSRLASPIW
jgi:hypothetical protein